MKAAPAELPLPAVEVAPSRPYYSSARCVAAVSAKRFLEFPLAHSIFAGRTVTFPGKAGTLRARRRFRRLAQRAASLSRVFMIAIIYSAVVESRRLYLHTSENWLERF